MRPRTLLLFAFVAVAAFAAVIWRGQAERDREAGALLSDEAPSTGLQSREAEDRLRPSLFHIDHDRFLPANDPPVMAGAEARFLQPEDEVYGFLLGGHARAYPVRMIAYHHVVNDRIDGVPIAVTY